MPPQEPTEPQRSRAARRGLTPAAAISIPRSARQDQLPPIEEFERFLEKLVDVQLSEWQKRLIAQALADPQGFSRRLHRAQVTRGRSPVESLELADLLLLLPRRPQSAVLVERLPAD